MYISWLCTFTTSCSDTKHYKHSRSHTHQFSVPELHSPAFTLFYKVLPWLISHLYIQIKAPAFTKAWHVTSSLQNCAGMAPEDLEDDTHLPPGCRLQHCYLLSSCWTALSSCWSQPRTNHAQICYGQEPDMQTDPCQGTGISTCWS